MDVPAVAAALADDRRATFPGARLQIDVHHEVFEPGAHYYAPDVGAALRRLAAEHDAVELREHEYFSDDELWTYLPASTCRCCRTASARTRAGWRPATTSAPR